MSKLIIGIDDITPVACLGKRTLGTYRTHWVRNASAIIEINYMYTRTRQQSNKWISRENAPEKFLFQRYSNHSLTDHIQIIIYLKMSQLTDNLWLNNLWRF